MTRILLLIIGLLLMSAQQAAALTTIQLQWEPLVVKDLVIDGYRVLYGTQSGGYSTTIDVGLKTTATIELPLERKTYYFVVVAYAADIVSGYSNEATITIADPVCNLPLGNRAISIVPTFLQKTGSGGAGSRARLDFQLGSPNSAITRVEIRANQTELASMFGYNLNTLAGMWFTVPSAPGNYPLLVRASNYYGCTRDQLTMFTVVVK